jgi:hypothetical protein
MGYTVQGSRRAASDFLFSWSRVTATQGCGGLFQNEETKRDQERPYKEGAAKAGGEVSSGTPLQDHKIVFWAGMINVIGKDEAR